MKHFLSPHFLRGLLLALCLMGVGVGVGVGVGGCATPVRPVEIRLRDRATKQPVAGVWVRVRPLYFFYPGNPSFILNPSPHPGMGGLTDEEGSVRLPVPLDHPYQIIVQERRRSPRTWAMRPDPRGRKSGEPTWFDLPPPIGENDPAPLEMRLSNPDRRSSP